MKYRKLGKTNIRVSEIGFGTWGLGGDSYGPVNDNESIEVVRYAIEKGINFFDTSDLYGTGHSERILGKAIRGIRDRAIIATKVGTLPHEGFEMPQNFSPSYLTQAFEKSLQRLGVDYADLLQLHSPTIETLEKNPEIMATLKKFKNQGKIREFGISVRSPNDGLIAIEKFGFKIIQVNYNMIDQRAMDSGLLNLCAKKNIGVIARTPLCFGFLTGHYDSVTKFSGKDHRNNWPPEQIERWNHAPELFSPLNKGKSRSLTQLALLFCLKSKAVSTAIPGMLHKNEVDENIQASALPLITDEEYNSIIDIYKKNTFYSPSAKK